MGENLKGSNVTETVKNVLNEFPECKNNINKLVLTIWKVYSNGDNIDVTQCPKASTIARSKRKVLNY